MNAENQDVENGTSQSWGNLRKAWKGYRLAKVANDVVRMKDYAKKIQGIQKALGVSVASFPHLGIFDDESDSIDWKKIKPTDIIEYSEYSNRFFVHETRQVVTFDISESEHAQAFLNGMVGVARRLSLYTK